MALGMLTTAQARRAPDVAWPQFRGPAGAGIFGNDYAAKLAKQGLSDDEVTKKMVSREIELTGESGDIRYMVSAFDARTGNTFSASPWAADGKVYLLSEDVHTFVIAAGDRDVELAKNSLDEMSLASPALAPTALFMRTQTCLYCIGR